MYSQKDPAWGELILGSSGLPCKWFGCTVTAVAQALTDAGYAVTPANLINGLNANGGFTADGLLIWAKVTELYPQFHFGGTGYQFVKGVWGKFQHWVLKDQTGTVDPYSGTFGEPNGYAETGEVRTVAIDPAPDAAEPAETPAPEVTVPHTPFQYTVQAGDTLSEIVAKHYGLEAWADIKAKYTDIAALNGIADPDKIDVGQVIKLP